MKRRILISFEVDDSDPGFELEAQRLLIWVANRIGSGYTGGKIVDASGEPCGTYAVEHDEPPVETYRVERVFGADGSVISSRHVHGAINLRTMQARQVETAP